MRDVGLMLTSISSRGLREVVGPSVVDTLAPLVGVFCLRDGGQVRGRGEGLLTPLTHRPGGGVGPEGVGPDHAGGPEGAGGSHGNLVGPVDGTRQVKLICSPDNRLKKFKNT